MVHWEFLQIEDIKVHNVSEEYGIYIATNVSFHWLSSKESVIPKQNDLFKIWV